VWPPAFVNTRDVFFRPLGGGYTATGDAPLPNDVPPPLPASGAASDPAVGPAPASDGPQRPQLGEEPSPTSDSDPAPPEGALPVSETLQTPADPPPPPPDDSIVPAATEVSSPPHVIRGVAEVPPPGGRVYWNQHPERLVQELNEALVNGVVATPPRGPAFDRALMLAGDEPVYWVLLPDGRSDGTLLVVDPVTVDGHRFMEQMNAARDDPDRIEWLMEHAAPPLGGHASHTVASHGEHVLSAGEAHIVGRDGVYRGLWISNFSGHYWPGASSLERAGRAFEQYGITFERRVPYQF
jgi:hypothetical protein